MPKPSEVMERWAVSGSPIGAFQVDDHDKVTAAVQSAGPAGVVHGDEHGAAMHSTICETMNTH